MTARQDTRCKRKIIEIAWETLLHRMQTLRKQSPALSRFDSDKLGMQSVRGVKRLFVKKYATEKLC
jgi:hypothetical protein